MTVDPDAFDAFEAASWEVAASAYDRFFAQVTPLAVEPLLDAAGVTAGKRVLDAATGPGYCAAAAAETASLARWTEPTRVGWLAAAVSRARGWRWRQARLDARSIEA